MAIAIDSSTPAKAQNSGGGGVTSPSFTPPVGSVLFVFGFIAPGTTAAPTVTDNLASHLTYTLWDTYLKDNNRTMALWTAPVAVSQAMTVTVGNSGNISYVQVMVLTGVDPVTPVGAYGHNMFTNPIDVPYTSTKAGSRGMCFYSDSGNHIAPAVAADEVAYGTAQFGGYLNAQFTELVVVKNANTGGAGTGVHLTTTNNNGYVIIAIWVEALPKPNTLALSETITLTDSTSRYGYKIVLETATIADSRGANVVGKVLTEAPSILDSVLKTAIPTAFGEVTSIIDSLVRQPGKLLPETATITDSRGPNVVGKLDLETLTITDVIAKIPTVARTILSETAAITDTIAKGWSHLCIETMSIVDLAVGYARIYYRTMALEALSISDTLVRDSRKALTETASTVDLILRPPRRPLSRKRHR